MTATAPTLAAECAVACPSCNAPADTGCTTKDGRPNRNPHNPRRKLWQEWIVARLDAADAAKTALASRAKDDMATQLLVLKVLTARVAGVDGDLRAQAKAEFHVGDAVPAYLTEEDRAAGRNRLGRVGMSKPSETWKITDVDKLTAWVEENHPGEIETRPVIRNSFIGALLASCKKDGGWVDRTTGTTETPPGIELSLGKPTLTVTAEADADELVAAAMAAGLIRFDGTGLALNAGNG